METNEDLEDLMYRSYLNPHPLLIPTIAKSVLNEFSYSELKIYRTVCMSWEYEISSILKEKTQIRLSSEKKLVAYISDLEENYCCWSYEFGPDVSLGCESMQIFFDMFGSQIKSLKLHQIEWSGEELWKILSRKLPNLEELSVRIFIPREANFLPNAAQEGPPNDVMVLPTIRILKLNFSIEKPYKATPPPPLEAVCPTILKQLLMSMPNLEQVYCPSWPTLIRPDKVVSQLFYNVIFEYPEIKLERLSEIHINAALDNFELFKLMDKNFPLRELRLELYPDVKPYCFYFLLKSLENTLQTLILIFHLDYDAENFDGFPILRNLEYLSLHKYCGPVDSIVRYLPRLKTLLLNDSYVTEEHLGAAPDFADFQKPEPRYQLNQLQEIIVEGVTYSPQAQLRVLVKNFPNLKKLNIQRVDDEMLRIIFENLINLEELIADGKFTDSGISGIPADVCQNIFEVADIDRERIFPYIGRLKYLRRLTLNSYLISFLSVLLGVNDCKNIKFKRLISPQILFN